MALELQLPRRHLDMIEEYSATILRDALEIVTSGTYPQCYRGSTALSHETIRRHQTAFIANGCEQLAGDSPGRRVPNTIGTLAELAGAAKDAHDRHALIFDERVELLPAVLYALGGEDHWICRPRALVIVSDIQRCDPRSTRRGVWRTPGKGGAYCEVQLLAEGRRPLPAGRAAKRFDRSVVRIAWTPVPCDLGLSDDALAAFVVDKLLDVVERASSLLRDAGYPRAAERLASVPICGGSIKFGAPAKKAENPSLSSFGRRVWLGYAQEIWEVLERRQRSAVFSILPTVETTGKNRTGHSVEPLDVSRLVFGRGTGVELCGKIEAFAAASRGQAPRTARRLRMVPVSQAELDQANLDPRASWWRWEPLLLRTTDARGSGRSLWTAIRRHAKTVHAYASNREPTITLLSAADANELHRLDGDDAFPFDLCLGRHRRRFSSAIDVSGHCRDETWRGAVGLLDALNVAFVSVALSARV